MRYAILADIHGNLDAFLSVINDANNRGGFDEIWCLGDVVGYGPEPHECLQLLKKFKHLCVAGNHDWTCSGKINNIEFNPAAAIACNWTKSQLDPHDITYLNELPDMMITGDFTLVHGSPREPLTEYLVSDLAAAQNLIYFNTDYCLVGHTHVPMIFEKKDDHIVFTRFYEEIPFNLCNKRIIINPGSVGQPRDYDPRAAYALYDSQLNNIEQFRVSYNIRATQEKMSKVELPELLIERLASGW